MISFPRSAARRLRLYARKSLAGRPRGPAPPVLFAADGRHVTLSIAVEDITVAIRIENASTMTSSLIIPMEVVETIEGADDEPVQIELHPEGFTATWTDRGVSRTQSFDQPEAVLTLPSRPKSLAPVPGKFLTALYEAGRNAAGEPGRYALQRVQVRGQAGEVIGTDAYFVYRQEGFTLPFAEEILVPAVPLFGIEEFAKASTIRIGRTAKQLIVVTDDVTVWMRIDTVGRFPDVAGVFPKAAQPTVLTLDPADALFLLDALPSLPGQDNHHRPVTFDVSPGSTALVRASAENKKDIVEVRLPRSRVKSGPMRIAIDRRYLIRMIALGCRTFRFFSEHKPIVAIGASITTLVMPVDTDLIVPPSPHARVLTPEIHSQSIPNRSTTMKTPEPSTNGTSDGETFDPLVETEALRNALGEAQLRLGRLLSALRSKKKEQKALTQVWSSLKSLNLGG